MARLVSTQARAYGVMCGAVHHHRTLWDRLYVGAVLSMSEDEMNRNAARILNRCSQVMALIARLGRLSERA